jgi:hypothetical protein
METFTTPIVNDSEQNDTVTPRLVVLDDEQRSYAEAGLFADYAREDDKRETSDAIEHSSRIAAEMIKRARDSYHWLVTIGRPDNEGPTSLPTVAVYKYDTTIPQHPWSYEEDDYVWSAELAISNPLPGIATVFIEARGAILATRVLQQGEILYVTDSGSNADETSVSRTGTIEGIGNATRVLLTAIDGTTYAANIPDTEPDGRYSSSVEAFVILERQQAAQ